MSITSSKNSFGTQFKAHIVANRAARHLRLKTLEKEQKKEKVVQSIMTSTVFLVAAKSRMLELLAFDEYCRFDTSAWS